MDFEPKHIQEIKDNYKYISEEKYDLLKIKLL